MSVCVDSLCFFMIEHLGGTGGGADSDGRGGSNGGGDDSTARKISSSGALRHGTCNFMSKIW